MKRGCLWCGLALVFALGGCAGVSPTPYEAAAGSSFGYAEQQVEANRYRVSFAGNRATSRETVQDYVLFRAAELTVATGGDTFTVVSQDIEATGSGVSGPSIGVGVGGGGNVGVGVSTILGGGGSTSSRYTAYADIVIGETDLGGGPDTYDAREVIRNLQPRLRLPENAES